MQQPLTQSRLVLLAQAGDRDALAALYRDIEASLSRFIERIMDDRHAAEEVLQDVFLIIYRKLKWLDDPRVFGSWVYRIAAREALRGRRRRAKLATLFKQGLPDADPAIEAEDAAPNELGEDLWAHFRHLTPASRIVLHLHYESGVPLAEIALMLDVPLGTVKSRLAFGIRRLRERLAQGEPRDPG